VKLYESVKTTTCLLSTSNKLCDRPLFGDILLSTSKSTYSGNVKGLCMPILRQLGHYNPTTYGGIVNKTTMYNSTPSTTIFSASSPGNRLRLDFLTNIIQFYESGLFSKGYGSGVLGCRHTYTNLHKNSNNIIYYNIISFYNFFIYWQTRNKM
jgi:hypothetical protein